MALTREEILENINDVVDYFDTVAENLYNKAYPNIKSEKYKAVFKAGMLLEVQKKFLEKMGMDDGSSSV